MQVSYRQHMQTASAIFDLEDRYARDRGIRGAHPRPMGQIRYLLVGEIAEGNREDYIMPREMVMVRNPSGYDIFYDKLVFAAGTKLRMEVKPATYVVRIQPEFYQTQEVAVAMPTADAAVTVALEPSYNYPFPAAASPSIGSPTLLRGSVHTIDGDGFAGVRVQVSGKSNACVTDATGQWLLVFADGQGSENVSVNFQWPQGGSTDVPQVAVERGQMRSLSQPGLRGWVLDAAGIPIKDVRIEVSGQAQESKTRADGSWFYYFDLNQGAETVSVTARLPDGRTLTRDNIQVQARSMVIVPTFKFA